MNIKELLTIRQIVPADQKSGSIQTKYKMARFLKETESDLDFYQKEFRKIIDQCAEHKEDGSIATDENGGIPILNDMQETFYKESSELDKTEVNIPDIRFSIEELADFDMSANDLIKLDPIIEN